ncbi:MAG: TatD family hydrolase [Rickettsiales bacterium]|jgi:TatD DNase family protein|nr:TatD family hydrolase [Rickettsiales bacterium]
MLIDTHCHLNDFEDIAAVIARARDAGVGALVAASAHPDDFVKNIALCEKYENIFTTIGIHPEYAGTSCELPDLSHKKIIGVGEIGLDYHYGNENRNAQLELFRAQLEIARRAKLPVAIHTREAEDDTAEILKEFDISGVLHCFTSSWDLARTMLDRGFYFSASGIITFKNSEELRDTFRKIPNDRIVIETDSPYCAPVPYRGKPCEPFMVAETAKILAQIKNLPIGDLEIILNDNTKKLYPKLCPDR